MLFGGLDTPVSMAIVPLMNPRKKPLRGSGPPERRSRRTARTLFVFRVSAVDESSTSDAQLRAEDLQSEELRDDHVNNPWGESKRRDLSAALAAKGSSPRASKFRPDVDVVPQLTPEGRRRGASSSSATWVLRAGREVARPHGLEGSDRVALGPAGGRHPGSRVVAKNVHCADVQLLRKKAPWARRS